MQRDRKGNVENNCLDMIPVFESPPKKWAQTAATKKAAPDGQRPLKL